MSAKPWTRTIAIPLTAAWIAAAMWASGLRAAETEAPIDLSKDKVLYMLGYSHMDTEHPSYSYVRTIRSLLKSTLEQSFASFEKYSGHTLNFCGARRYDLAKEYHPDLYAKLKQYIAQGRWCVAGACVDEYDANLPSPESLIRHALYGNAFFRREYGKESFDCTLPDTFGFPASLPTILVHSGLKGFSGNRMPLKENIVMWEGPDGSAIVTVKSGDCTTRIGGRLDIGGSAKQVLQFGEQYGVAIGYRIYGRGDYGGGPRDSDVQNGIASLNKPDSQIRVVLGPADQMYRDLKPEHCRRLPRRQGDLPQPDVATGTFTSQACMKRWNRRNENLADAAERAAVAAAWLGGARYPSRKLADCWWLVLGNQQHDIICGTCNPDSYRCTWNDEIVALNGFAAALADSAGAVARALDTTAQGQPLVVYNPLACAREDVVEAQVRFPEGAPAAVRVVGPDGKDVAAQVVGRDAHSVTILFLAATPPVSFSCFDVLSVPKASEGAASPRATERVIENASYRVTLDDAGDIARIVDKEAGGRDLLAAPARLVFLRETPGFLPAWHMEWKDRQQPPLAVVGGPARVRVLETGPVRAALEIEREAQNSIVTQQIRLAAGGAGRRVEIRTTIDWQSKGCSLKAAFPLAVENAKATYSWTVGTVERGNNDPVVYETCSHEWRDLTDATGAYGVSILDDCKFGSDKPDDRTLRLTLLYTPGGRWHYSGAGFDQQSQDFGRHEMTYAVYGHRGDWREGVSWQARRLNQPLIAFQAPAHAGPLGKRFSLARLNTPQVDVRAVKKAEDGERVIVRLNELQGREAKDVALTMAAPIASAWEVDGEERRIGDAALKDGRLVIQMKPYALRAFAVTLGAPPATLPPPDCAPVAIPYAEDVVSANGNPGDGDFDGQGRSLPAEMLPDEIASEGIQFKLGGKADGAKNAVACRGQAIALPKGEFNRVYLLAAATEDTRGLFRVGASEQIVSVQCWTGLVGQYDTRVFTDKTMDQIAEIKPGFTKRDPIAWFCTHRHNAQSGDEPYEFSYLFKYGLDLPAGASSLTLPDNPKIVILAVTAARHTNDAVAAAQPLYDDFTGRRPIPLRPQPASPPAGQK